MQRTLVNIPISVSTPVHKFCILKTVSCYVKLINERIYFDNVIEFMWYKKCVYKLNNGPIISMIT